MSTRDPLDSTDRIAEPDQRPYDVVLWGATGYTGQRTADHLVRAHGDDDSLRWALAGRSREKLEQVRQRLAGIDPAAAGLPILVADGHDPASLDRLCRQTRAVCATVGPFALHGAELVAACLRQHTHYCDTTGEPAFIRQVIDTHHETARDAGLRLVCCCGMDSVPSDLGVLLLHDHVRTNDLGRLAEVTCLVTRFKGGYSGGTLASMLNFWQAAARDRQLRQNAIDPYGLNDEGERQGPDRSERPGVFRDPDAKQWAGLFLMAPVNTRVVRRSNQVQGYPYGTNFCYSEHRGFGPGTRGWLRAQQETAALAGFFLGAATPPTRWLLRRLMPAQGEGPSGEQAGGRFRFEHYAHTEPRDHPLRAMVAAEIDMYAATGIFAAEAAVLLARPPEDIPTAAGVLTPASGLGLPYVERLRKQGITLTVEPLSSG